MTVSLGANLATEARADQRTEELATKEVVYRAASWRDDGCPR